MNLPIQYLRGIASVLVVFAHFSAFPLINSFSGAIGVDIFFIISGYIMSMNVIKYYKNKSVFLRNRIIRIFPLYLFLSMPLMLYGICCEELTLISLWPSIFFIGGDFYSYKDPLLFAGWSLFYEFVFYVLIISVNSRKWANMGLLFLGIIGLLFEVNNILGLFFNSFYLLFFIGFNLDCIFYYAHVLIGKRHFISSIVVLLFVMLSRDSGDFGYVPRQLIEIETFELDILVSLPFSYLPRVIYWGFPSLYFILNFIAYFKTKSELVKLRRLGDLSYSIYLVHATLFLIWAKLSRGIIDYTEKITLYLIIFILIWPLSFLTYKYIEVPFLSKRNNSRAGLS